MGNFGAIMANRLAATQSEDYSRPLKHPRHEILAQELALGKARAEAFATAEIPYSKTSRNDSRLFKTHPEILKRVRWLQERNAGLAELNAQWVLERLKRMAETNIDDFYARDAEGRRTVIDLALVPRERMAGLAEVVTEHVQTIGEDTEKPKQVIRTKIKIDNGARSESLKMIAVHVGMRTSNSALSDPDGGGLGSAAARGLGDRLNAALGRAGAQKAA